MGTGEFNAGGNPAMDWHPIQGGVEIFLVASCHGNRDKLRPDGPLGSYADFTFTYLVQDTKTLTVPPSTQVYKRVWTNNVAADAAMD